MANSTALEYGTKLAFGFGILVLLTLLVIALSALASREAIVNINRTEDLHVPTALASLRAQANLLSMLSDVQLYLVLGNEENRQNYQQTKAVLKLIWRN